MDYCCLSHSPRYGHGWVEVDSQRFIVQSTKDLYLFGIRRFRVVVILSLMSIHAPSFSEHLSVILIVTFHCPSLKFAFRADETGIDLLRFFQARLAGSIEVFFGAWAVTLHFLRLSFRNLVA